MNYLFVLERLSSNCGANVIVALRLMKYFQKNGKVYAVVMENESIPLDEDKVNLFDGIISFSGRVGVKKSVSEYISSNNFNSKKKITKLLLCLKNPNVIISLLLNRTNKAKIRNEYKKNIEKACKEWEIGVVIGITAPYYIAEAISKARIGAKKTIIQLDPFTNNYTKSQSGRKKRLKHENNVLNKLETVFVPDYMLNDMLSLNYGNNSKKFVSIKYPGIVKTDLLSRSDNEKCYGIDDDIVRFVYAGMFYDDIRNPSFLLSLFDKLPNNYELHFIGGGSEKIVDSYKSKLGDKLKCYGYKSAEDAIKVMEESDILVNLSNSISNQMSSKITEYISTGRPILNIFSCDDCPSLDYLKSYSNCCCIREGPITEDLINETVRFVNDKKGIVLSKEDVLDKYYDCTDEYVASLINSYVI